MRLISLFHFLTMRLYSLTLHYHELPANEKEEADIAKMKIVETKQPAQNALMSYLHTSDQRKRKRKKGTHQKKSLPPAPYGHPTK